MRVSKIKQETKSAQTHFFHAGDRKQFWRNDQASTVRHFLCASAIFPVISGRARIIEILSEIDLERALKKVEAFTQPSEL